MNNSRDAILEGAKAASRLHNQLGTRESAEDRTMSRVDVVGVLVQLGVTLLFRPLEGLLGFYLPGKLPGVVVSTQRPLPIQRFTAAHELGHFVQEHEASFDTPDIIERAGHNTSQLKLIETAANSFAAEFLIPNWLVSLHARLRSWDRTSLKDRRVVYQMSLRLGVSYEATCRTLLQHKHISRSTLQNLLAVQPKQIKQEILGDCAIDTWHPDVWLLTDADEGTVIEGGPNDVFAFELREKGASGYLWNINELRDSGFAMVKDERDIATSAELPGSDVTRYIVAQNMDSSSGDIWLQHRQPWNHSSENIDEVHYSYDLRGREEGRPRLLRMQNEAA